MKKIWLLFLLGGCQQENLISPSDNPVWLGEATQESVRFWEERGAFFTIKEGGLPIETGPLDAWGVYEEGSTNRIIISDMAVRLDPVARSCIVSHELGHVLGMGHVEDVPSLMNPVITICANELGEFVCCWSDLDQAEFERVSNGT